MYKLINFTEFWIVQSPQPMEGGQKTDFGVFEAFFDIKGAHKRSFKKQKLPEKNAASCGTAKTPQNLTKCLFCGPESKSKFRKNHEIRFLVCRWVVPAAAPPPLLSASYCRPPLNIILDKAEICFFPHFLAELTAFSQV